MPANSDQRRRPAGWWCWRCGVEGGDGEGHQAEATALGVAVDGDFAVFVAGQVFKDRSEVAALHGEGQVADVEGQGHVSRRSSFRNDA